MILFNFNVLARPDSDFNRRQPEQQGVALWRTFNDSSLGNVGIVVNEWMQREQVDNWLTTYRLKSVLVNSLAADDPVLKAVKIQHIMSAAGRLDWYIDNDPATIAETLKLGIPSLLVTVPYVVRPEWHADTAPSVRSWNALVNEVERQAKIRMERGEQ